MSRKAYCSKSVVPYRINISWKLECIVAFYFIAALYLIHFMLDFHMTGSPSNVIACEVTGCLQRIVKHQHYCYRTQKLAVLCTSYEYLTMFTFRLRMVPATMMVPIEQANLIRSILRSLSYQGSDAQYFPTECIAQPCNFVNQPKQWS